MLFSFFFPSSNTTSPPFSPKASALAGRRQENTVKVIYRPPINKQIPNELDVWGPAHKGAAGW